MVSAPASLLELPWCPLDLLGLLEEDGVHSSAGVGSGAGETASGSRAGKTSVSLRMIARVAAAIMPSAVSSTRPFCSL